jgi:hypothetical protein
MIKNLYFLFIVLVFTFHAKGQIADTGLYYFEFNNTLLKDALYSIENKTDYSCFYKNEWIDSIYVTLKGESLQMTDIFEKLLLFTPLNYVITDDKQIFLVTDKRFVKKIPYYTLDSLQAELAESEKSRNPKDSYLKGREPNMIATITVGSKLNKRNGKFALVKARLFDEKSREPLIGATLYIRDIKKGAATDINGELVVAVIPGKYTAEFQCLGMQDVRCILDVQSEGSFELLMKEKVTALNEVTVSADENIRRNSNIGLERISIKSVKEIPAFMGEKDVIKISQLLPGVVSVGEGSSGINVRGGNTDQNLFYLNNIPVYNTSHLFGFFSSVNSTIINQFALYKGFIPAKYGGRLSSVISMETRKGNKNKFFAQGGISPISANIEVENPIIKNKCSILLSARSSYSDWILKRLQDPSLRNSSVKFADFAGSVDYDIDQKNRITLFTYFSFDDFNYNHLTKYNYSNEGIGLNYTHWFHPSLKSTLSLVQATYAFSTNDITNPADGYEQNYSLNHYELKNTWDWKINDTHDLNFGISTINYRLNRGNITPFGTESIREVVQLGKESGLESSIFIEDKWQVTPILGLSAGIRLSNFINYGPATIQTYLPGVEKTTENISGELVYQTGEIIKSYTRPELRLSSEIKLSTFHSLKLSYTQMQQYLFMLSNTISIAPNDQWKLVDYHIKPPKSDQISLGYSNLIPSLGISTSTETYYKWANNFVEYKDGADFLNTPNVETTILQGNQKAFGAEFMVSKDEGSFNGWISYTYSRSTIMVNGTNYWEEINFGKSYPSNYDKPHVCNLVMNYRFNKRFSVSSNVVYSTGRPITLPEGVYYMDGKPYVDYSLRNEYRIPEYFRVDFSVVVDGNLRVKKPFHSYWMFSVYNATGRRNAQTVYFRSEDGKINGYKYSVVGEPIFTISWNFKLGNYSNN